MREEWRSMATATKEPRVRLLLSVEGEVVIGYRNDFYPDAPWWCCEDEGPVNWGRIYPNGWLPLPVANPAEEEADEGVEIDDA